MAAGHRVAARSVLDDGEHNAKLDRSGIGGLSGSVLIEKDMWSYVPSWPRNALFAGADSGGRHWSIVATLIQTAKLNDVEPLAYVLRREVSGQIKQNELHTLLPWNWKPPNGAEAISSA